MYVKMTGRHARLFETSNDLNYGTYFSEVPPDKRDVNAELGEWFHWYFPHELDDEPTPRVLAPDGSGGDLPDQWRYRYAFWHDENLDKRVGVFTSRNMFILNSNGKTIDKA